MKTQIQHGQQNINFFNRSALDSMRIRIQGEKPMRIRLLDRQSLIKRLDRFTVFVYFGILLLDPDPYELQIRIWILIQKSHINADRDSQHCSTVANELLKMYTQSTANSPGERNAVGRVIRICDGEGEKDVSVGLVLLHEHGVVTLGEEGRVVVGVLNEDVDEDAGGEQRRPKVPGLHLQHWENKNINNGK